MGMDQSLFRTTKKCHAAKIAFCKLRAEYDKKVEEVYNSEAWKPFIESLPRDEFGHFANNKFSAEQRKRVGVWRRGSSVSCIDATVKGCKIYGFPALSTCPACAVNANCIALSTLFISPSLSITS